MKHILTCSFGKDSIATALLALQHGEPLDELVYSEVMFSDTVSGELPEHKRFIYETAIPYFEKRGIPTRVLRGQKTYLDCFYHIVSRGNAEGKLASFPLTGRCGIQTDTTGTTKGKPNLSAGKVQPDRKRRAGNVPSRGAAVPAICVHRARRLLVLPQCVHAGT